MSPLESFYQSKASEHSSLSPLPSLPSLPRLNPFPLISSTPLTPNRFPSYPLPSHPFLPFVACVCLSSDDGVKPRAGSSPAPGTKFLLPAVSCGFKLMVKVRIRQAEIPTKRTCPLATSETNSDCLCYLPPLRVPFQLGLMLS